MVATRDVVARLAGVANVGSAAIHFVMTPVHLQGSAVFGVGFLVAAWAQLGVATWLLRGGSRRPHVASLAVNVVIAGVWLVSRTVGLPVGGGAREAVAFTDATATGLELLAVVLAVAALAPPGRRQRRLTGIAAAGATSVGTVVVVAMASAAAVAGITGGHPHEDTGAVPHAVGVSTGHGHPGQDDRANASSGDARPPSPDYWRNRLRAYRAQRGITGPPAHDEDEAFRQLMAHLGVVPPKQGPTGPAGSTAHDDGHAH